MNKTILNFDEKVIGTDSKPFIIAEMSGNHNQSIERALSIIDAAAAAGAHAIKLQTYTPDTMTIDMEGGLFSINDKSSLWHGQNLYNLYKQAHTPWEWHQTLFDHARKRGIIPFSTPFDETAVDFLESLNCPIYKIASFENVDIPLLKKVAQTGKPVIMSIGAATLSDLDLAVNTLKINGCLNLTLLKCTSSYPASPENTNLLTIPHLKQLFNCNVGLSDHTMGIGVAIASIALGAVVVEKHFTLRRADGGVDSAFSIEPEELKSLVLESERAFQSLGIVQYGVQKTEEKSIRFKRSIYVVKDIEQNEVFTKENIKIIRPGDGLIPKYYGILLGKKAKTRMTKGTPLSWDTIL